MAAESTVEQNVEGTDFYGAVDRLGGLLGDFDDGPEDREPEEVVEEDEETSDDFDGDDTDDVDEPEDEDDEESFEEDEDDEAEDEADDSDDSHTYMVKVDGEEVEVTLDEALAGYSRTQDYTRKTMALAEQREELKGKVEELTGLQADYGQALQTLGQALSLPEVDWTKIKQEDPENYTAYREQYDARKAQLDAIQQQQAALAEQMEARRAELQDLNRDKLEASIPDWADADVRKAEQEAMVDAAVNTYGWSQKELETAVDYRLFMMLRDAMKYRESIAKADEAKDTARKTRKKGKTLKPGSPDRQPRSKKRSTKKQKAAKQRLRETGRIDDAASAIAGIIDL